jgi:penicillin-binding protein 1C
MRNLRQIPKHILNFLRRTWRWFALGLLLLIIGVGAWLYANVFVGLPSIDDIDAGLALPSTRIYDRNGALLYEILPPEQGRNRPIALDDIPDHCINAIVATEDANYWTHPGVDVVGIVRALWWNLREGGVYVGGSTITQQTARLLLLDAEERTERTLARKLREMVLALQLQNATSKEDVLALYLNQAYFGNLAYGIEAAAQTYFHKGASELALNECAMLMGLVQNASLHDPLANFPQAKARQRAVLGLMVQNEYLTQAQADNAYDDALQFGSTPFPIQAPHAVMAVWKQLEREYGDALYTRGLDVVTTIDLNWTRTAERIAQEQLYILNNPVDADEIPANAHNASLVALDPYTGQVLVMLGSPDYFDESIDGAVNAALAMRQPGSTLKPFTYAAAMYPDLPAPYTAATMLLDVRTPFVTEKLESYVPGNYGLVEHGPVSLRTALASSYNIPAVVALEHIGIGALVDLLGDAGIPYLADNMQVDLSITLGGGEVRLLDLVQAYAIFPNGGYYVEPSLLLSVTARDGEVLYEWQAPPLDIQVLDERIAYIITDILADNHARLPAFGNVNPLMIGRPSGAKTGTTTDFRDNWVVGYTPNLVTGVWVGNADNQSMIDVSGISGAGPIYNQFMRDVLLGQPELDFTVPDGLVQAEVCALSGKLPTLACPNTRLEWFIEGTAPTEFDDMYHQLAIDTRTGQLADAGTPEEYVALETFIQLPPEAQQWGQRNGIRAFPDGASVAQNEADVRLLSPDPYTVYELSPIVPVETQRIRLRAVAPDDAVSVTYLLNGEDVGSAEEAPYSVWWQLALGNYEVIAIATMPDGTTLQSEAHYFGVVDYDPAPAPPS